MEIKLLTGKTVKLDSLIMTSTYGGVLVGKPNKTMNDEIISFITHSNDWGNKKVLVKKKNRYTSKDVLKPSAYKVLLLSEPVSNGSKTADASCIVLVWFGDADLSKSINQIIAEGVGNFDWDKHAENISY
jgi:hypothetical protein